MDIKVYSERDFPAYLPKLNALYDDLFSGGKGFRARLTATVSESLSLPAATIHLLCQTVEFIHNSSLLHDDLIDRSPLRRGKTTAWLKYTPEYAVLAGDYLLARVMVNLSEFGNIQLVKITSQAISDLLEGEWLQDGLVKSVNVTVEDIDRVHDLKTGSLFKWCLTAPFIAGGINNDGAYPLLRRVGEILGLLLQRSDDLLDFDVRNGEGKNIMGDLKAGYVNSFCARLFAGLPEDARSRAATVTELEAFKNHIGADRFAAELAAFDAENTRLIEEYQETLSSLAALNGGAYAGTADALEPLARVLYWRKP